MFPPGRTKKNVRILLPSINVIELRIGSRKAGLDFFWSMKDLCAYLTIYGNCNQNAVPIEMVDDYTNTHESSLNRIIKAEASRFAGYIFQIDNFSRMLEKTGWKILENGCEIRPYWNLVGEDYFISISAAASHIRVRI